MLGSPLAGAPPFQSNIRGRYEIKLDDRRVFFQVGAVHQAQSLSSTTVASVDAQDKAAVYHLAAFTTLDGALGVAAEGWSVQVYGENLTDARAQLFANYYNFVKAVTISRPRTMGFRVTYAFGGG